MSALSPTMNYPGAGEGAYRYGFGSPFANADGFGGGTLPNVLQMLRERGYHPGGAPPAQASQPQTGKPTINRGPIVSPLAGAGTSAPSIPPPVTQVPGSTTGSGLPSVIPNISSLLNGPIATANGYVAPNFGFGAGSRGFYTPNFAQTGPEQLATPQQIQQLQQQYPGFNVVPNWSSPNPWGVAPNGQPYQPGLHGPTVGGMSPQPAPLPGSTPGVTAPVGSGGPTPAMVGAPPTPNAYAQAIQQSFAPYFQQSQNDLAAQEAAMGTLQSGQANKDFQDLTARNNATLAGAVAPLIQQGFGQQFSANQQNASAYNQVLAQMLGINANAQQQNANLSMQGQEFNAQLAQQMALAQAGFANQDYLNAIGQLGGLESTGLGGLQYVLGQGMQNEFNGYNNGYNMLPYIQGIGQGQGYQYPSTVPGVPGNWMPGSTYNPYPGGLPDPSANGGVPPTSGPTSGSQLPPPDNGGYQWTMTPGDGSSNGSSGGSPSGGWNGVG